MSLDLEFSLFAIRFIFFALLSLFSDCVLNREKMTEKTENWIRIWNAVSPVLAFVHQVLLHTASHLFVVYLILLRFFCRKFRHAFLSILFNFLRWSFELGSHFIIIWIEWPQSDAMRCANVLFVCTPYSIRATGYTFSSQVKVWCK